VPLLGPIGGGLAFGASPTADAPVVAGGAAPSSAALTTSLELLLLLMLLFLTGKHTMLLLADELALLVTLGVRTNPEAADAMLQLAMLCSLSLSLSLSLQNQWALR
jgi:hypothetical protein